jgi:exopolyphosphatase/guanosine-5'-triphosphate,3'-diphosphate pyrophosphatase
MVQAPNLQQAGRRRVAAIDIGTNSIHLLVAEVDPELSSFSVVLAEKATTSVPRRSSELSAPCATIAI